MDYDKIQTLPTASARIHSVEEMVAQADYISITDALVNYERGGAYVLQTLSDEQRSSYRGAGSMRTWKIKAIQDRDGNPYKPGDEVHWEVKKGIRVKGRKLDSRQIKDMERRGDHAKLYEMHTYTVGEDGCIECGYTDAVYLLHQFGIHYKTGIAVTSRREMSREPIQKRDGTKAHLHFWRYSEVPPGYEPKPKKKPGPKPKKETKEVETPKGE